MRTWNDRWIMLTTLPMGCAWLLLMLFLMATGVLLVFKVVGWAWG